MDLLQKNKKNLNKNLIKKWNKIFKKLIVKI